MDIFVRQLGNQISYKKLYLTFFLFLFSIHVASTLNTKNLRKHVQKHTGNFEENTKRYHELYSKVTSQMLQIRGKKINAKAPQGSKWAKMAFYSTSFGGGIIILGVESGRYLCMSKRGKLVAKKRKAFLRQKKLCQFTEKMEENFHDSFSNALHPNWKIAVNKNGKPRRGPKTTPGQTDTMFLKLGITTASRSVTPITPSVSDDRYEQLENRMRKGMMAQKRFLRYASTMSILNDSPPTPGFEGIFDSKTLSPAYEREMELRKHVYKDINDQNRGVIPPPRTFKPTSTSPTKPRKPRKNKSRKGRNKKGKRGKKHRMSATAASVIDTDFVPTSRNNYRNRMAVTTSPIYNNWQSRAFSSTIDIPKRPRNRKPRRFKNKRTNKKRSRKHRTTNI